MDAQTYFLCFLSAVLAQLFYLFAFKIPAFKERMRVANEVFTYGRYFADDSTAIIASFLAILLALVLTGELLAYKPDYRAFIITIFAGVGWLGTSAFIALFGKAQSKLNAIIDKKTDIADNK